MTYTITEVSRTEQPDAVIVTEDHCLDGHTTRITRTETVPQPEDLNREALADMLHATLARIAVRDDVDPDIRAALLLMHRFLHADYSDAEV